MNRTAKCIKMLIKLRSNNQISTAELARYLDTNPRNIREYRKELEEAGYHITEIRGRHGGYMLDKGSVLPMHALTDEEQKTVHQIKDFLKSQPEFTDYEKAEEVLDYCLVNSDAQPLKYIVSFAATGRKLNEKEQEMLETAKKAIEQEHVLEMEYQGRDKEKPGTVLIQPYRIVCVENHFYLIAWDTKKKAYRNYKFSESRMHSLQDTGYTFEYDDDFNYEQYIGMDSAFKGHLIIYTVLVRDDVDRLFKEEEWGTGLEEKEQVRPGWHTYSFTCDNPWHVFTRLFTFGDGVELTGPEEQRQEYISRLESILKVYKS